MTLKDKILEVMEKETTVQKVDQILFLVQDHINKDLFKNFGICGHCRKKKCPDRGYVILPDNLNTDIILKIIEDMRR